jgi:phthalate 4,5-dioxygenase reductase subunit
MRQYSLCGSPADTYRYWIAVKRKSEGRGGSISMTDQLSTGDEIHVGVPQNLFELSDKAKSFIFIAGGIGITPMMSMINQLQATEDARPFRLYYLSRTPEGAAFVDELTASEFSGKVKIHHTHGDSSQSFDLWPVLEKSSNGTHVYCCGPTRLMDSVRDMTGHWPQSTIHFESFGADTKPRTDDQPFDVTLGQSNKTIHVQKNETLLEALIKGGCHVPSSCESGTCGSCKVRMLQGNVDHRDLVLMPEEKNEFIMVCVSRSKNGEAITIDL